MSVNEVKKDKGDQVQSHPIPISDRFLQAGLFLAPSLKISILIIGRFLPRTEKGT